MDTEHRHELKTNELADFLARLPDFMQRYSNQIIGVCLILIALLGIPLYKHFRHQSRRSEQIAMVSRIQSAREAMSRAAQAEGEVRPASLLESAAEELRAAASSTNQKDLVAIALLESAKLLRAALYLDEQPSPETISANLSKAESACKEAFETAQSPTLKGLAELALGLCAEEAGQYEQARQVYTQIIQNTAYAGTSVIEQAKRRLDLLDDNAVKVVFAPAPAPEPQQDQPAADTQQPETPAAQSPTSSSEPAPAAPVTPPTVPAPEPAAFPSPPAAP